MFVLELYFLLYRVPRMMTRLARERSRSAVRWSLLGIAAWLGAEFAVMIGAGIVYGLGVAFLNWPEPMTQGFKAFSYVLALVAALVSTTVVSRMLMRIPAEEDFAAPPLPPEFSPEAQGGN